MRHVNNVALIQRSIRDPDGIARLADTNHPLWVFSLNHDVIIECLAADYGIPLNSGFTPSIVTLPTRDSNGVKIGELRAEVTTGEQLAKSGMPFLQPGNRGINLLKVHGSLDTFAFRDGKDLLKLFPLEGTTAGVIETLRVANEELVYVGAVKATNEIAYADDAGEMQFLRRSLLAGAFKFDSRMSQVLPMRLLDYFRSNINYVGRLICIGYGFGDAHINQVLRDWLEFSADRQLEIVAPGLQHIPAPLLHLAPQVKRSDSVATDHLDAAASVVRTRQEVLEKHFGAWVRRHEGGSEAAKKEFEAFREPFFETRNAAVIEKLKSLPMRDGDVDLEALGIGPSELAERWAAELKTSPDDLLEAFLKSRESKG